MIPINFASLKVRQVPGGFSKESDAIVFVIVEPEAPKYLNRQ
jgi:hypothetical protein